MRHLIGVTILAIALSAIVTSADAKGCVKGAIVGGVAGHHGLIGAAAGCVFGRHEANKRDRMNGGNRDRPGRELPNGQEHM